MMEKAALSVAFVSLLFNVVAVIFIGSAKKNIRKAEENLTELKKRFARLIKKDPVYWDSAILDHFSDSSKKYTMTRERADDEVPSDMYRCEMCDKYNVHWVTGECADCGHVQNYTPVYLAQHYGFGTEDPRKEN